MTWTKLGDEFGDECAELSDAAFRTHTEGLIWTMRRETGGFIEARQIKRWAESPHFEAAVLELVATGWWSIERQGYRINHHMEHQPEPQLIAKRREMTNERVRKHRLKKAGLTEGNAVSERVTRDGTGRVGAGTPTGNKQQQEADQKRAGDPSCSWCQGRGCPDCQNVESELSR